jgi:murein DD-endopeptidase MepM/ murein hydrolase activator NlpD
MFIAGMGCVVLAGCFSPQKPAPVTLYGNGIGAGSAGIHTVTNGETIYDIARRYNIVMRDIVVTNELNAPFTLAPGMRLKLPPPQEYRVRPGDTIYQVSRLFAVGPTEIAQMNDLSSPYALKGGQVLKLPSVTEKTVPYALQSPVSVASAPVAGVEAETLAPPPVMGEPFAPGTMAAPSQQAAVQGMAAPGAAQGEVGGTAGSPAASSLSASGSTPGEKITVATPARASSRFLEPVRGTIVSGYGPKPGGLHNDGINIAAARGTPVAAADNGVVVYAGDELKGSGNLVLIRHADRWMTAYAHMDGIKVKRGDVIRRGQTIGTVGATGSVDAPQLHFEVRRGTEAINPKLYLES